MRQTASYKHATAIITSQLLALGGAGLLAGGCERSNPPQQSTSSRQSYEPTFDQQSTRITEHLAFVLGDDDPAVQSLRTLPVVPMESSAKEHAHAFGSFDPLLQRYTVRRDVMEGYPVLALSVQLHEAHHATDSSLSFDRRQVLKDAVESSAPGSVEKSSALIAMRRYWFEPEVHAFHHEAIDLRNCSTHHPLPGVDLDYWNTQLNALVSRAELFEGRYSMNVLCTDIQATLLELELGLRNYAPVNTPPSEAAATLLRKVQSDRAVIDALIDEPSDGAVVPSKLLPTLHSLTESLQSLLELDELKSIPETHRTKWLARMEEWKAQCEDAEQQESILIPQAMLVDMPK